MADVQITVLMPAFNAEKYIAEAIASVLQQSYRNFELLIINDGSTDRTAEIITSFTDERITVVKLPLQTGISNALNIGLKTAKGDYIARFDADDVCTPQRLERQIEFLITNPGYILVGCDAEYITEEGEHLFDFFCSSYTHDDIMRQLRHYCPFIHSGVMYRRQDALNAGGYPLEAHNFEDYLLWTQMAKYGKYCNLAEQLLKVRFNAGSVTIDEKWRGRRFRQLKRTIIHRGSATQKEGAELLGIIKKQNHPAILQASYYALCGKKFLVNNFQPGKARTHLAKAISYRPFRLNNYALYMLSFFPRSLINWLHQKKPE